MIPYYRWQQQPMQAAAASKQCKRQQQASMNV